MNIKLITGKLLPLNLNDPKNPIAQMDGRKFLDLTCNKHVSEK